MFRSTIVLVDEAAFLPDSQAIDSALAAVSDARIDVSTPHAIGGCITWSARRHDRH